MSEPIRVVIDTREEDLLKLLDPYINSPESEWKIEKANLDVGDIAFYKDERTLLVFERKTAEDLGASQKDGRYREQRARLQALRGTGTAIGYIVEAPSWSPSLTRTWCRGTFSEIHLQQAIIRLQLRYMIPVFLTHSLSETSQWIRRCAKSLYADPTVFTSGMATTAAEASAVYTEAIHVKKAMNRSPDRIFLSFLLSIPGFGRTTAEAIGNATNYNFARLYEMNQIQLCEIQVGKKKLTTSLASSLYTILHQQGSQPSQSIESDGGGLPSTESTEHLGTV